MGNAQIRVNSTGLARAEAGALFAEARRPSPGHGGWDDLRRDPGNRNRDAEDGVLDEPALYAASCPTVAAGSSTEGASGSVGNVTLRSLLGLCLATISNASSRLSACTATPKRAAPLLTWTEILIISPHLPAAPD